MSMLLCDFHIHTTWSDGSVDLPEVVDIYGQAGFDVDKAVQECDLPLIRPSAEG